MRGYMYQADLWCESCGNAIRQRLDAVAPPDFDPDDEAAFDSDDYPKSVDVSGEADSVCHCAGGAECLEALEIGTEKYGAHLENELTAVGVRDVIDSHRSRPTDLTAHWMSYYCLGYDSEEVIDALAEALENFGHADPDVFRSELAAARKALAKIGR